MKTEAIKKINKMGEVGSILIVIAKVFCIIGFVGCLIGTICIGLLPKDFISFHAMGSGTIEVNMEAIGQSISAEDAALINSGKLIEDGNVQVKLDVNSAEYDFTEMYTEGNSFFLSSSQAINTISAHNLVYCVGIATISMAMTVVSLFFAGFLCKAFKNCNSPFEENVIKKMQMFAYSLIPWVILTSISNSMVNSLVSGKFNVNVSIDLSMLLVVLIILALAYIFKYGAVLQQESDETL